VAGIGPSQQWTEWTITNGYPTCLQQEGEVWSSSLTQNFCLLVKNSNKLELTKLKRSSTETRGDRLLGCSNWRTLALKLIFLTTGEFKTISPVILASHDEAKLLAPPPSASLAPEGFGSEVVVASLLARSGALIFALRQR